MAAIDIQRAGATAILTMNRPEQRNALDYPMREARKYVLRLGLPCHIPPVSVCPTNSP
jgi:enoyl-CoA hydratase/carnithine racemase